MGLEAVVEEIRDKGQKEVEQIRAETRSEVNRILQAAQTKAAGIKQAADDDVGRQASHILSQETSAANLIVKRTVLNAQKQLLDRVYQQTLAGISELPEDFHRDAIRKLLLDAKKEVPDGLVHYRQADLAVIQDLLAKDPGLTGFRIGKVVPIEGGVVVESTDGRMQIDCTYRTHLTALWESGLRDASNILFG